MHSLRRKKAPFCFLAAFLAAATGIGASVILSNVVRRGEDERLRLRFERVSVERVKRLEESLRTNLYYAEAIRAFYLSSKDVDRTQFHSFVQHFLDSQSYIIALEWVPVVTAAQRPAFEAAVRREGFPQFVIADSRTGSAEGPRDTYYPVLFSEPFAENQVVLGLDYGSIPGRLEAMQTARRLGRAQATGAMPLHGVHGREDRTGIQIFIPVYAHLGEGSAADTSRVCRGFVSAVFVAREMTEYALADLELAGVDISFYEENADGERKLIYTRWSRSRPSAQWNTGGLLPAELAAFEQRGYAVSQKLDVAGLHWWVTSTPAPRFFAMYDEQNWRLVLLAGIALSVITGYVMLVTLRLLLNREERTRLHLAAVVESSADAIYTKSLSGTITTWNSAAERLFGFTAIEIIGKPVSLILPSVGLQESSKIVEPGDNESRVRHYETVRVTKEGKPIDVSLSVSPIRGERGEMIEAAIIARDITERKHIERMKDDFIHLASHQLRTPLSAVRLYTEMLLAGHAGELNPEQREFLNTVATSTHRMVDLVSTLLNISRIESAALIIRPLPHYLGELLNDVLNELETELEAKQIGVEARVEPDLPMVLVDPVIVHEIYTNLISNAIKYSPKEGVIHIDLHLEVDRFVTSIEDTGYGIPQKDHDRVFSRFYRGQNILKYEQEGTGMGLYLVRSLCELSGCKISFDSDEGKGTTFWFAVPRTGMKERAGRSQLETLPSKERFEHV